MSGRAVRVKQGRALRGPRAEKTVCLALQGGGAHGAFTWGVLDAILEDGRLAIEAITGASAGAMNAVVLAEGWRSGGAEGARAKLAEFWQRVSLDGGLSPLQRQLFDRIMGFWGGDGTPGRFWFDALHRNTSPYQSNPLDINPLKDALLALIDFEAARACGDVRLFISATNVWTGKIRVFDGADLTVDHLLASACLPTLFRAVEIDGEPYWDGGYMGNPPLFPLFYGIATDDVVLVQINPVERRQTPRTAPEIENRLNEIIFNGNLLRELRAVEFVTRLIESGKLSPEDYKRVLMHRIEPTGYLDEFPASSRASADWDFFQTLRDRGQAAGRLWLEEHYDAIGVRSTLDLRHEIA